MAALIRERDWSTTSLGSIHHWPPSLRAAVDLALDSAVPMALLWGAKGVMIYNDAYASLAGRRHPAALGSSALESWPELADFNRSVLARTLRGESLAFRDQHFVSHRRGVPEDVWFDLSYSPVKDESGTPSGAFVIVVETTDRMLTERKRQQAEAQLRLLTERQAHERQQVDNTNKELMAETHFLRRLFEQAPSFIAVLRGPTHVFELTNPPYLSLIGARQVVGLPIREALPELRGQGIFELLDRVYRTGEPFVAKQLKVVLVTGASGEMDERVLDFVYQPLKNSDGEVQGIFVEGSDVTERYFADERFRIAQRAGQIGAFEWYPDRGMLVVTDEYRRIWGLAPDVPVTDDMLLNLVVSEDRKFTGTERFETANPLAYAEYRITRPDNGEIRWIARQGEVLVGDARAPRRYVGVCFDITERKRVEEALQRLNATLEVQVEQRTHERDRLWTYSQDLLVIVEPNGRFRAANPAWKLILGYEPSELIGTRIDRLVHPDDLAATLAAMERASVEALPAFENRYLHKNGGYRWVSWTAAPDDDLIYGIGRHITAEKQAAQVLKHAEEQLRQSQKMEAVGQLTGGIAHDFNNLLQGIVGSLDVVQKLVSIGRVAEIERFVTMAKRSANRAAALTHRLLAFSRRQPLDPKPVDVNQLMTSMDDLLRRTLGPEIELQLVLAGGLWKTLCDHNQLENAVLNLAINSRDAMPTGGKLTIETCNAHLDDAYAAAQREVTPGQYVCVCVTDTGTGMPPDVILRAFDPFFTTKPLGQGTGLGLSMIYGFVRQSEGHVKIYSEVEKGTTVKLYLPRLANTGEVVLPPDVDEPGDAAPTRNAEVVLVVEDEVIVRELILVTLRELGYHVLWAADGPGGLAILESSERIDLLVTDVGLPGLNGRQIVDAARTARPHLKVLFMTGYAENATLNNGFLDPGMQMLTKPFALDMFASRVRRMLEAE